MIRNLKALGLALFALLAMGAMTAASASAQEGHVFETEGNYPVHLVGTDVPPTAGEPTAAFTTSAGTLECSNTSYTSNITASTKRLTITPVYGGCSTSSGQPVTVTMNGCDYEFHHATTLGADADKWSVTADLKCTGTNKIEIHEYSNATNHASGVSNCTATVPAQNNLTGATITEETGTNDALEIKGSIVPDAETHGACSFGFTIKLESTLHLSATVTATEGKKVGLTHP